MGGLGTAAGFIAARVLAPHPRLEWRELGWALLPAALYRAYALARGALDGWYAYWFLNPARQRLGAFATRIAVMLAAFVVVGVIVIGLDRWMGRRTEDHAIR